MSKSLYIVGLSFLMFSCQEAKQERVVSQNQALINDQVEIAFDLPELAIISHDASDLIQEEVYFSDFTERLTMLREGSKTQFLDQGDVLTRDARLLRDSTQVKIFLEPGSQSRINGMYTMSLRLKDMNTTADAFSQEEVYQEVLLLIQLYNSLVERVNSIALKNKYERAVLDGKPIPSSATMNVPSLNEFKNEPKHPSLMKKDSLPGFDIKRDN